MRKSLLLLVAAATLPLLSDAQELKKGYITWPDSQSLYTYVTQWNGGSGKIQIDNQDWEDEEFFTSHVRPRARFTNTLTQVYPDRMAYNKETQEGTDKRLVYWVCAGEEYRNGARTGTLPNGVFDQEVFNMWSYVDNFGIFNCPYGWTPGVWADVCHRNGVSTHGVAGTPNATLPSSWSTPFAYLSNNPSAVGKFLHYHGQNGLGYNSEFSTNSTVMDNIMTLHNGLRDYMKDRDPLWEVMWYAGTNDYGSINFDQGTGNFTGLMAGASMFMNYNWNNRNRIAADVQRSKDLGYDPFLVYAGMNMQGGEPKSGDNYPILKDYQYSIGLWAGWNDNILWKNRQSRGSSALVKQASYNLDNEMLFGNGKRNPAIKQTITTNRSHGASEDFAGYSSMMNARSAMNHVIATEPFYTYFNLGNGQFFNYEGERANNNPWYNIGIQDYVPTWRWWFAPSWLQTDVTEGSTHLNAEFTWEDAYMGGSCLKISGTSALEYLHLLKTDLTVAANQTVTVRYKLLKGKAKVRLILGSSGRPQTEGQQWKNKVMLTEANCEAVEDNSYREGKDGWTEYSFVINAAMMMNTGTNLQIPGGKIGIIGLEFTNADNMELLIGEISIKPRANTTTPKQPTIASSKLLSYNSKGVDAKLVWKMANSKAVGEPVYNDEVNASVYKLYSQQEGQGEVLMGMTTSWAAHIFSAPVVANTTGKMRFGVSAVSVDQRSESAITWTDYMELPGYEVQTDIQCDKPIIKPGEEFTLSFVDPQMTAGTWVLRPAGESTVAWQATGQTVTCPGLPSIGAYDLVLTYTDSRATQTATYPRYVSITSTAVGALPDIYSLSVDGQAVTEESSDIVISLGSADQTKKFSYTGRYADGKASRGVQLDEKFFGVDVSQLQLQANQSFSVAAWVKIDELPDVCNLLTIENITASWPVNRWGYFWHRINTEGRFKYSNVDGCIGSRLDSSPNGNRVWYAFDESKLDLGAWNHVVWVFEYSGSSMRLKFYINGKQQLCTAWIYGNKGDLENDAFGNNSKWDDLTNAFTDSDCKQYGTNTYEPAFIDHSSWTLSAGTFISIGGSAPNISAMKGAIDDFQVWNKAMTDDDVQLSLSGLDASNLPANVAGYWDFESDFGTDNGFTGKGGSAALASAPKAYLWQEADKSSDGEAIGGRAYEKSVYSSGSPFIGGEAYPIVTKPTWSTRGVQANADGTGEQGSADITFPRQTDYSVDLTLSNGHGSKTMSYPVVHVVPGLTAIDGITADEAGVATYTVDGTLFLDFGADGNYTILVYDMAGMQRAAKQLSAVAGQTAQISLATKGVYLVKVIKDGNELRTVKIVNK